METDFINRFQRNEQLFKEKIKALSGLHSQVFIEIPRQDLQNVDEYKEWLIEEMEVKWMREFNSNLHWYPSDNWNDIEGGIYGNFGEIYIRKCKLYHFDGTIQPVNKDDWRGNRGILLRDHYTEFDVAKVHIIADNLCSFLSKEKIVNAKFAFEYKTRRRFLHSSI